MRRSEKVNVEALLIGAEQNIKRLLTHGHRGLKRPMQVGLPCASLLPNHTSSVMFAGIATDTLDV